MLVSAYLGAKLLKIPCKSKKKAVPLAAKLIY